MTDPKRIAGMLGPVLVALNISEALNPQIWRAITAPITYLSGALWFVSGLAIVRDHNRWTTGWPVLITLAGWFAMAGGLLRMFAPEFAQQGVQTTFAVLAGQMILLAIGIVLTFKAYLRTPSPRKDGH